MQFIHQPLTWAFFLVLLPLLIHLINLMRQRRVEWAAMEFLLQAYKKRRNWIWLKQFLLLLARMLAIAAAVAMLAKLVTREQWTSLLGGTPTHHYVLLDDSLSMGERLGGSTAFDRAVKVVGQLLRQLSTDGSPGNTRFTLLRYSRASQGAMPAASAEAVAGSSESPTRIGADKEPADATAVGTNGAQAVPPDAVAEMADFNAVLVDVEFDARWSEQQSGMKVSELAVGPEAALNLVAQRIEDRGDERAVVHVVTDFRANPWNSPREIGAELARMEKAGASVRLIRCVERPQANLSVTGLRPADGVYAAGVPLFVEVSVHNYGDQAAEQVPVALASIYYPESAVDAPAESRGIEEKLPDLLFESIPPGETVTRRTQVFFPTAGQHVVRAGLPPDNLPGDNQRWCVIDLPATVPVLVIDQDPQRRNADFLATVFQPSQRVETGVRPIVESPSFLRDITPAELQKFGAVYLLDCESLDPLAVQRLEQYTRDGGGVAFFLGPLSLPQFYRDWYADGEGMFPVPVQAMDLLEPTEDDSPDMLVEDHPLFQVLLGQRNSFLGRIRVPRYQKTRYGWQPPEQSSIRVLARLRNGQPLVVERAFGKGRVVASMTTLAPIWNTWATEPTFVVFLLELQAYLQQSSRGDARERLVGTPLELNWDETRHQREVAFALPAAGDGKRAIQTRMFDSRAGNAAQRWGGAENQAAGPTRAGVYEAWLANLDGSYEVLRRAVNVDPSESDLALSSPELMAENLPIERLDILLASAFSDNDATPQQYSMANVLLGGLAVLLVLEQLLSYSASYHPLRRGLR